MPLDKQLIAIHIKTDTTSAADTTNTPTTPIPDKTRYLHYDNLGSIDTITDGQGNIVERMSYAAFGERRKGDWRASDPLLKAKKVSSRIGVFQRIVYCIAVSIITLCVIWRLNIGISTEEPSNLWVIHSTMP
jgi:hypothetical protein